jgi:hypothetical protein
VQILAITETYNGGMTKHELITPMSCEQNGVSLEVGRKGHRLTYPKRKPPLLAKMRNRMILRLVLAMFANQRVCRVLKSCRVEDLEGSWSGAVGVPTVVRGRLIYTILGSLCVYAPADVLLKQAPVSQHEGPWGRHRVVTSSMVVEFLSGNPAKRIAKMTVVPAAHAVRHMTACDLPAHTIP